MLRIEKIIKPWKESAALGARINLYGFWNETAFLTKSGDLGMVLRVTGVDYESLNYGEQEYAVKRLEAALKNFGAGFHVYQYLFKANNPEIPFAHYEDPIVQTGQNRRQELFAAKADRLFEIEIYCVLIEGSRSKTGVGAALMRLFSDPFGGWTTNPAARHQIAKQPFSFIGSQTAAFPSSPEPSLEEGLYGLEFDRS